MNAWDTSHGTARGLVACAGLLILAAGLLLGGLSTGAELTEVLGFLLTLASLAGVKRTDEPLSEEALATELESLVGMRWRSEARIRRLADWDFVPLGFMAAAGSVASDGVPEGEADPRPAFWSAEDFQAAALALYRSVPGGQLVVIGERGSGKSVLSLMLTLAIVDPKASAVLPGLPVPLPVSISSWRPASEDFARWFERRMLRAYPVMRRTPPVTGNGPVWDAIFSCKRKCLPILDGLDEIPVGERGHAVEQLTRYFHDGAPFVLLSRSVPSLHGGFPEGIKRLIVPVPAETAARYFEHLQGAHGVPSAQMAAILRSQSKGNLRDLFKRPLYLDLARRVLEEHLVTQAQLIAASDEGEKALENFLISWNLRYLLQSVRSGGTRKGRHLVYLAEQMTCYETPVLPWWRLADWVPADVLIASVAVITAIPAYLLALRMPVGLTRGLAIGVVVGMAFGMLRGRSVRWADLGPVSVLLPLTLAIEGWCAVGLRQGLADAVEISTATILAIGYRAVLFKPPFEQAEMPAGGQESAQPQPEPSPLSAPRRGDFIRGVRATRPWHPIAILTAIGLVTTAATALVSALLHFHDPQRTPTTIFMAGAFGIGIAAAAARLLIVSPDRMEPSTVLLRRGRRVGGIAGPSCAGLFSAMIIGVGGGVTGGLRLGLTYGVMLTIVFGLLVGIPVGVVGTVIRWLSAPRVEAASAEEAGNHPRRAAPSTLRTDRTVTVAAVIGIGAAAAAGISTLILIPPLHGVTRAISHQSSFGILPADGILFGLTIGLIVACFNTAWPTYALAHFWLVLLGRSPIRLEKFLDELHHAEILRKEGSYLLFRHYEFQRYLSEHGAEFAVLPPPQPGGGQQDPRSEPPEPVQHAARDRG